MTSMMMTTLKHTLLLGSALLTFNAGFAQSALRASFVEGADVMFYLDGQTLNTSGFSQAVQAQRPPEETAEKDAKAAQLKAATGLGEEDVLVLAFSMDLDGIDFQAQDPEQLENAKAVLAVDLNKAVTLDQVKAGLEVMAEDADQKPTITKGNQDGLDVLILGSAAKQDKGPDQAFATLSPDGKTVLLSFNTASLKDGLSRIDAGKMAAPSDDMAAAIQSIGDRHLRMALVLPMAARKKIQEGVQAAAAQGGMGGMMAPFATTKSLLISANSTENLDLSLSLDLGNPGNATQAAGMMQGMLPMLMMGMQQQLGPQAMTLSQKIKIAPRENAVTINVNLTPEDVKMAPAAPQGGM
ncbi:MAG: hypothetical protein WD708_10395 [Kiritimatiellia bacterium]